jgi:hypothetical protein
MGPGDIEGDPELAAKMLWPLGTTDAWQEEAENIIAVARKLGLNEGVKGVSTAERKPVMPNMRDLAYTRGDLSTRQAYTAAYRPLSVFTHASARGFMSGAFVDAGNGTGQTRGARMRQAVARLGVFLRVARRSSRASPPRPQSSMKVQ